MTYNSFWQTDAFRKRGVGFGALMLLDMPC